MNVILDMCQKNEPRKNAHRIILAVTRKIVFLAELNHPCLHLLNLDNSNILGIDIAFNSRSFERSKGQLYNLYIHTFLQFLNFD